MTNVDVARAFSGHRFEETFEHLADDITWRLPGQTDLTGKQAVVDACLGTLRELGATTTTWLRFVSTADGDVVAVDVVGRYDGPDGVTAVSSCDVYEFADGLVTTITSYAVEVPAD